MEEFSFYQPTRMEFGCGKVNQLGEIVKQYGKRCLLVTTTNEEEVLRPLYERVRDIIEQAGGFVRHFDEVIPNPDVKGIEKAIQIVHDEKLEVIVAVGGGSSIDTAKAIALFENAEKLDWDEIFQKYTDAFASYESLGKKIPVIAVPTTAGTGSEMTQAMVLSQTEKGVKMCVFHPEGFAEVALIDPELTRTLPPRMTAMTGFDAFTHAFESYMRECSSIYTRMIAKKAMEMIIGALPRLVKDPSDIELRAVLSQAAAFAGISLSNAAATIPHPLSEVIGGVAPRIAHGQCLASLYPAYLDYIWEKETEKCAAVSRIFDPDCEWKSDQEVAKELPKLVRKFLDEIGIHKTLSSLGVTPEEFQTMLENPVFSFLPFAPKDELFNIMKKSY